MPEGSLRVTVPILKILKTLIEASKLELSGAEIAKVTGLGSGTMYPVLLRLEGAGWLTSYWEAGDPKELGRPRRRYYQVTPTGLENARSSLGELQEKAPEKLSWA